MVGLLFAPRHLFGPLMAIAYEVALKHHHYLPEQKKKSAQIQRILIPLISMSSLLGCYHKNQLFQPFPQSARDGDSLPAGSISGGGKHLYTPFQPKQQFNLLQVTRARQNIARQVAKRSTFSPQANKEDELTAAVKEAIIAEAMVLPRPVWGMALKQFLKLEPSASVNDSSKVLDQLHHIVERDTNLQDHSKRFLQDKLLKSLRRVANAEDKNILTDHSEAVYIAVNKLLSETKSVDTGIDDLSLKISPKDLVKAYQFFCDEEYCQASLIKPAQLDLNIPLPLNANVDIVFSRAYDPQKDDVLFEVSLDGTCHPVKIANIFSIDVSLGINLEYYKKEKKVVLTNPRCSLGVSCDTPIIDLSAKISQTGISFDGAVDKPGKIPDWLVKMAPEEGETHKSIPFDKIDDELLAMYRQIKGLPPRKESDPDISWADLFAAVTVEYRKETPTN